MERPAVLVATTTCNSGSQAAGRGAKTSRHVTLVADLTTLGMTRFVASQLSTSHWYDISAARRDLGYDPKVSVEEGLRRLGERLRVDFTIAQMSPRVTLAWNGLLAPGSDGRSGRGPDSLETNERVLAAKQRFMRALDAVGPELSGILVDVCCMSRGLEAAVVLTEAAELAAPDLAVIGDFGGDGVAVHLVNA